MPVTLTNASPRAKTFNLCTSSAPLRREYERTKAHVDGQIDQLTTRVVIPDSLTLLVGETSRELPDLVVHAPEVSSLIRSGVLKVNTVPDPLPFAPKNETARVDPPQQPVEAPAEPEAKRTKSKE